MQNLILNRYRVIDTAGKGGFATVQVAWDTRIQRRVAIKCLPLDNGALQGGGAEPARIPGLDEARTAAMLSDSDIVGVYDFEISDGMAYLIMEYVDGVTLTRFMHDYGGPLPLDIVASVFGAVSHALEVAHENQVLHLDIKPDNVLIDRQGQVKVSDFGLAELSHSAGFGQAEGGTIGYMPLEQMRLEQPDERTDEWALAALTYEMLTGDNPFLAPDLAWAEAAIEDAELVVPSLARGDMPAAADDVLFDALSLDREDRFCSVRDFADALEPYLGNARQGKRQLAVLVGEACEDYGEVAQDDAVEARPAVSFMSERARAVGRRVFSAAACALPGVLFLANIPQLFAVGGAPTALFFGLCALCVVAALASPALGALLSVAALVAALFTNDAVVMAVFAAVAGGAWWFFSGRNSAACASTGLAHVWLGALGLGALSPLVCGYVLKVRDAAICAAFSFGVAVVLASSGSMSVFDWSALVNWHFSNHMEANAVALLAKPATWVQLVAWMASAVLFAICCLRGSRPLAFVGAVASAALIIGSVLVSAWLASGMASWTPSVWVIVPVAVSCAISMAATLAGVPWRERER